MDERSLAKEYTGRRYSLGELTEAAGVSVRTVRYYIAEGLLPPAVTAGARSFYTQAHLDRLRLIGLLKEAYLPLKEIRRRLAGLDDAEVRRLLAETAAEQRVAAREIPSDSAADYIARIRSRALGKPRPTAPPAAPRAHAWSLSESAEVPEVLPSLAAPPSSMGSLDLDLDQEESGSTWRRVPLSDDAELLIREDAYQRRRDQVDWLIRWARKVFD
ncbi:MAG TPA: MerR family transcriptional regulator [Thermomicrobiales bacterium]